MNEKVYKLLIQLDANNSKEVQENAIKELQKEKDLSIFMQPNNLGLGKKIWENCALILYSKTDGELLCYMNKLLEWLQDMNWPGAIIIFKRLKMFEKNSLEDSYKKCIEYAKKSQDEVWLENLYDLYSTDKELSNIIEKMLNEIKIIK